MGTAGGVHGEFRTAIRTGSFKMAMSVARTLPRLGLVDALDLTVLAAQKAPSKFPPMSRRFITRLIEERDLSLTDVAEAAIDLESCAAGDGSAERVRELIRTRPMLGSLG